MKVYFDTNIIIDILLKRELFFANSPVPAVLPDDFLKILE